MRSDQRPANQLRDTTLIPDYTDSRGRLGADRGRPHESDLHRQRRGSRAAVPAQQRQGLGDGRVRHAAARDQHAHAARGVARQGRRPDAGDSAADRPSLRAVTNLPALGERTVWIDCDVIQADGGTRTASITGAFVALALALEKLRERDAIRTIPLADYVAAISVGIVDGEPLLDLAYEDDSRADVDMNIVKTGDGRFIEVQGTAEAIPFGREALTDAARSRRPRHRATGRETGRIVGHLVKRA